MSRPLALLAVILGLFIVLEAVALVVGMFWLSPKPNPWTTHLNAALLITDGVLGSALFFGTFLPNVLTQTVVLGLTASHFYREIEYFGAEKRFLINVPLLMMNTAKLVGLLILLTRLLIKR